MPNTTFQIQKYLEQLVLQFLIILLVKCHQYLLLKEIEFTIIASNFMVTFLLVKRLWELMSRICNHFILEWGDDNLIFLWTMWTNQISFQNNLLKENQGGLSLRADSRGSATSLRGWIHHNLFVRNKNRPVLYVEGRQSSPYQEVIIYKNYVTQNKAG